MEPGVSSGSERVLELLRNASRGSQQAFALLFEEYRSRLERIVAVRIERCVRFPYAPEDVVQHVYLEASRRLSEYMANPAVPFFLWLRLLSGQKVIELRRRENAAKRGGGRVVDLPRGGWPEASSVCLAECFIAKDTSPSHVVARDEMRGRLAGALDRLDPGDREVILLRHFEQLTNIEAATVLKVSPAAAAQRHLRALKRLKHIVDEIPGLKSFVWRK